MADDYEKYPTSEAKGIDRGYDAVRDAAKSELKETMTGPEAPLRPVQEDGIKDPDGEFEVPARMPAIQFEHEGPGPNQTGNSSGRGPVDPQGQQAGTLGGQKADPRLPNELRPLANAEERALHSGEHPQGGAAAERNG
jgi:hypothetical protein